MRGTRRLSASKMRSSVFGMLLRQVLNHVGEIVARIGQPLMRAGVRIPARAARRKTRHIPTRDEITQSRHARMVREPAQRVDSQRVRRD